MTEEIKLSDLKPDHRNANKGTERGAYMVEQSLRKLGAGRSILLDKHGKIIAGNKTAEAAGAIDIDDVVIVRTDGKKLVAVMREDLDLNDDTGLARELAYADNRASEVSLQFDPDVIASDLEMGVDLGDWFQDWELEDIQITPPSDFEADIDKDAQPSPRDLPIDVIFTISSAPRCCVSVDAGFLYGVQSSNRVLSGTGVCLYENVTKKHTLSFIDNDYFNYDHQLHLGCVTKYTPKYCTVMDVMTKSQCEKDKIEYCDLAQILDWAEELNEHAENVIVIPKYDCLDQIPDKFMLGYSVPTSHGGTPLPLEMFKGRRVHLLGGSWTKQLQCMGVLGDDVASLDNNYENIKAEFGQFTDGDGIYHNIEDVAPSLLTNGLMSSLVLGLGAMGAKINELYRAVEEPAKGQ